MENPPETSTTNLPATIRCDGWTRQKQSRFLRALASSHSVKYAARAAGMSRQSAYALRSRLKGEPFDLAWYAALQCRFDALGEAALERAMHGVEVPHYYKGELVGTSRRFDERLTVALLAMRAAFAAPCVPSWHDAAAFGPTDFAQLVERVETGPETWKEEAQIAFEAQQMQQDEGEESDYAQFCGDAFEGEDWDDFKC